jgi:iron complex outermembrane receptor protein
MIRERPEFEDERTFAGIYALTLWSPSPRWNVDTGLRLNATEEKQEGELEANGIDMEAESARSDKRLSGSVGASLRIRESDAGVLWLFGAYTSAFKPAAVDFGPEAEGQILKPETAESLELGLKGLHAHGHLSWQTWLYRMDFENLVVSQTVNGLPSLTNAGTQRFEGIEVEERWHVGDTLDLQASFAAHSAKFRDYVAEFDGVATQLAGNRLEMSPDRLASLGVTWHPTHGLRFWGAMNYVGERYMNKRNTALARDYTALSAGTGYRFDRFELRLDGTNLTDERDPVSESELGEAQFYRLPGRFYRLALVWRASRRA